MVGSLYEFDPCSTFIITLQDGDHLVAGEDAFDDDGEFLLEVGDDLAQRWVLLLDHLGNAACEDVGFEASVFLFLDDGQRVAEDGAVVWVVEGGLAVLSAASEAGGEVAGLDQGHLDAEAANFGAEGFGEALDGKFRGRIEALVRQAHHAADGAEVDDFAVASLPHIGQDSLTEVDAPHEVGAHLEVDFFGGGELKGTADAHAGVVDEDVDTTFFLNDSGYGGGYLFAIAHVALAVMDGGMFHGAAAEAVDGVTFGGEEFGGGQTKARRGTGDEDDLLLHNGL